MSCTKPATSCHLWYGKDIEWPDISSSWTLECSVEVEKSFDCTNFIAIGKTQCLKITEKVAFNFASEAS